MPPFLVPGSWPEWRDWGSAHGPDIAGILAGLLVVRFLFHRVVSRVLRQAAARAIGSRREDPRAVQRRADTLLSTMDWTFTIFLALVGTALLLEQFEVQVSALIAGVGIAGVAIGLGAQTLIKDVINGLFILLEGQYAVGDTVTVGGATGEVVEINPRRTVVRDEEGNMHSIPNSAISVAVNRTPALAQVRVDAEVPFRDSEEAVALVNAACHESRETQAPAMVSAPSITLLKMAPGGRVRVVVTGEARPGRRWEVESDLRHRLKRAFETAGIELEFPATE